MKKVFLLLLVAVAGSLTAGPLTISITTPDRVHEILTGDISIWAQKPPLQGPTTCGIAIDCCPATTGASQAQCLDLAKSFGTAPDFWVRQTYDCLAQDSDWQCEVFGTGNERGMVCQTVPATASVRLEDVARCLAIKAFYNF